MHRHPTSRATLVALAVVATSAVAAPATSAAQIAPGSTLVFTGTADATEIGSPGVLLDFGHQVTVHPSASSGTFASLTQARQSTTATMETLTVGNGPQWIPGFLRVGPYTFDLAHLPSGSYGQDDCYVAPAVGQRCTPYQFPSFELSPFYLENRAAPAGSAALFTALVAFDVHGTVTGHGGAAPFVGTLTARFEGLSYQEALGGLEAHGLQDVPFTGTFVAGVSAVPEPSTAALVAVGLAGVAGMARRRSTRDG
jgi:hypothetical protein